MAYPKDACEALSTLLGYPGEDFPARAAAAASAVACACPAAVRDVAAFVRWTRSVGLAECEEAYVRSFDGNAERALEVGWQVFGEQYARGAFLVRLREGYRQHGVQETSELPDHLTQVLRLLPRLPEAEARSLVATAVAPALARIRRGFAERRDDPYAGIVESVGRVLGIEVPAEEPARGGTSAATAAAGGRNP